MKDGKSAGDRAGTAAKPAGLEARIMRLIQKARRDRKMLSYKDLATQLGEPEIEIRSACANLKRKGLITG